MKIDSPTYSLFNLQNKMDQTSRKDIKNPSENSTPVQNTANNNVQRIQGDKVDISQTAGVKESEKKMPESLSDVLSVEEQVMIHQLFNNNNTSWGVSAYQAQALTQNNLVVGKKLDLSS